MKNAALSSFRGGPVFPGMFVGAAGGIALSHLPGLLMIAGAAMGIGAMTAAMLGLPLTSVLLATSPQLEGIGGRYFDDCNEAPVIRRRNGSTAQSNETRGDLF